MTIYEQVEKEIKLMKITTENKPAYMINKTNSNMKFERCVSKTILKYFNDAPSLQGKFLKAMVKFKNC